MRSHETVHPHTLSLTHTLSLFLSLSLSLSLSGLSLSFSLSPFSLVASLSDHFPLSSLSLSLVLSQTNIATYTLTNKISKCITPEAQNQHAKINKCTQTKEKERDMSLYSQRKLWKRGERGTDPDQEGVPRICEANRTQRRSFPRILQQALPSCNICRQSVWERESC